MTQSGFRIPLYKMEVMTWKQQELIEKHRRQIRGVQTDLFGEKLDFI